MGRLPFSRLVLHLQFDHPNPKPWFRFTLVSLVKSGSSPQLKGLLGTSTCAPLREFLLFRYLYSKSEEIRSFIIALMALPPAMSCWIDYVQTAQLQVPRSQTARARLGQTVAHPQGWGSSSNDHQSPVHQSSYMGGPGTRYRSSVQVLTMPES